MSEKHRLTRKEKEKTPLNPELKMRVLKAKERLPGSGISSFFLYLHPDYNTTSGRSRLHNVLQSRVTDETITVKLEALADLLEIDEEAQRKYKWLAEQK